MSHSVPDLVEDGPPGVTITEDSLYTQLEFRQNGNMNTIQNGLDVDITPLTKPSKRLKYNKLRQTDLLDQKRIKTQQVLQMHNRIRYLQNEENKKLKKMSNMQESAQRILSHQV